MVITASRLRESPQMAAEEPERADPTPLWESLRRAYRDRGGGGCSEGGLSERTALAKVQASGRARYGGAHTARSNASEKSERALLLQGTGGGRDHLAFGPERKRKHLSEDQPSQSQSALQGSEVRL